MSPANRAGIDTKRPVEKPDPVVVASSGPYPSATLHEDRFTPLTARYGNVRPTSLSRQEAPACKCGDGRIEPEESRELVHVNAKAMGAAHTPAD